MLLHGQAPVVAPVARQRLTEAPQQLLRQHVRPAPAIAAAAAATTPTQQQCRRRCQRRRGRRSVIAASAADPDKLHEEKLGPNVAAGIKDVKENRLTWSPATVIRNEAVNLDGTHRLLHMSVSEDVDMLYGRKIQGVPDGARWMESFTVPGQFVGVRSSTASAGAAGGSSGSGSKPANGSSSKPANGSSGSSASSAAAAAAAAEGNAQQQQRLYAIACSPYETRRDSAYIGGSIVEVVVDRRAGGDEAALADLAPGAAVEVSQVVGRGFASLFNSYSGLPASLEEQRNILVLAVGLKGIAAVRSALNWAPVQAHASSHRVAAYYVTRSPSSAAFLAEWDAWREAGVAFHPLYTEGVLGGSGSGSNGSSSADAAAAAGGAGASAGEGSGGADDGEAVGADDIISLLEQGLFLRERGLEGAIGGRAAEATVLLAGMSGDVASAVAKELTFKGVAWERLLFCDYF